MAMRNPVQKGRKKPHQLARQTEDQEGKKGKQTQKEVFKACKAGSKGQAQKGKKKKASAKPSRRVSGRSEPPVSYEMSDSDS